MLIRDDGGSRSREVCDVTDQNTHMTSHKSCHMTGHMPHHMICHMSPHLTCHMSLSHVTCYSHISLSRVTVTLSHCHSDMSLLHVTVACHIDM